MCQSFPAAINPNPFPPAGDHFRGNTHSCLMEQDFQPHFRTGCQQESIFLSSDSWSSWHWIETTDLIKPLVEVVDGVVEGQDDQLRHPLCAHVAWKQDLSFFLLQINIFARNSCCLEKRFEIFVITEQHICSQLKWPNDQVWHKNNFRYNAEIQSGERQDFVSIYDIWLYLRSILSLSHKTDKN